MDDNRSSTSPKPPVNNSSTAAQPSVPDTKLPATSARPLYSSKVGDTKAKSSESSSSSPTTRQSPQPSVPQQRAWAPSSKNPITGRSYPQFNNVGSAANRQSVTTFFQSVREGNRVYITVDGGAEFEGIYASNQSDSASFSLRMVQQKKSGSGDIVNGSSKREHPSIMSFQRDKVADARIMGGNQNKADGRAQNGGSRTGFRTDTGISGGRAGEQRKLERWQPDTPPQEIDGSLEQPAKGGASWDQFAVNQAKFGVTTTYDENIYTTAIDKQHPQYRERLAAAERKAREIERSGAMTAHVAEERVMDHAGGEDGGADEEDKYSGVKRQDFPPLSSRETNKYTPPARRAPAGHTTVKGAPVDPAIISSILRAAPNKSSVLKPEDVKASAPVSTKTTTTQIADSKAGEPNVQAPSETKANDAKPAESSKVVEPKAAESKPAEKSDANLQQPSATAGRNISPSGTASKLPSNATATVERDVLDAFQNFASEQRKNVEKNRITKAKADRETKLTELKKFADSFKLASPVPKDLIGIIAKDPSKQKEIQDKARLNAEEILKKKEAAAKDKEAATTKDSQAKPSTEQTSTATSAGPTTATDNRSNPRAPAASQHANTPNSGPNRHSGNRQSYAPSHQQPYRNDRSAQNGPRHNQQTGHLAARLRNVEQTRMAQQPPHHGPDMRLPPTGPANAGDMSFNNRRLSGLPPNNHMGQRLNPHSNEFRPNAFAPAFHPTGASAASSPHSAVVHPIVETQPSSATAARQVLRRVLKKVEFKKCFTLGNVENYKPPPETNTKFWEESNGNLRPSFDTKPNWKDSEQDEKLDMTYKAFFERQPFAASAMTTPNPAHVVPQMAHQHQLPFHLQQGGHGPGARQSPHMPPMQMHGGQPGHGPHVPFNGDDNNRMMHSNSAQSYASPRPAQVPMSFPSPAQMPYNPQAMQQPFMGPGQQMQPPFRYSQNQQFMQQPNQMGPPLMGPQFMGSPNPMMVAPQMQMYPGAHPQFVPGQVPPQAMPGPNGYPSPGRPAAAPMMSHQGSQQGQYGMSPGIPYQQPVFISQQSGQMGNMRYNHSGPQQYGTSPQQVHHYNNNNNRNGNYGGGKNFQHGQHQGPSAGHAVPTGPQGRNADGQDEAK